MHAFFKPPAMRTPPLYCAEILSPVPVEQSGHLAPSRRSLHLQRVW